MLYCAGDPGRAAALVRSDPPSLPLPISSLDETCLSIAPGLPSLQGVRSRDAWMNSLVVEELAAAAEGGGGRPESTSAPSPDKPSSSPGVGSSPSSTLSGDSQRPSGGLDLLLEIFGSRLDVAPSVRALRLLLGVNTRGAPPSLAEIKECLAPMAAEQLRAIGRLIQLDLPAGRWNAQIRGGRVVLPLARTCADIFAAFRSIEALPASGGGGAAQTKAARLERPRRVPRHFHPGRRQRRPPLQRPSDHR
jgi:hypothetical protein